MLGPFFRKELICHHLSSSELPDRALTCDMNSSPPQSMSSAYNSHKIPRRPAFLSQVLLGESFLVGFFYFIFLARLKKKLVHVRFSMVAQPKLFHRFVSVLILPLFPENDALDNLLSPNYLNLKPFSGNLV